jgi:bifunctional non-homologous end joining protein LigD
MPGRDAAREELPRFIEPMLAGSGLPAGDLDTWSVELKWDGCRGLWSVDRRGRWCLRSRPGRNCTSQFPELESVAHAIGAHRVLLDGELVHLGPDGKPDFAALRHRLSTATPAAAARAAAATPATLVVFDLLHLDGRSTRALPYARRRQLLADVLADAPHVRVPRPLTGPLVDVLEVTRGQQLEGVVCKRLDRPYQAGRRSTAWLKHKHRRRESFLVSAWTPARPGRREPDTLYLARAGANRNAYQRAGSVQLGLSSEQRAGLRTALAARETSQTRRRVRPVEPGIRLEVDFHGGAHQPLRDPVIRSVLIGDKAERWL